MKDFVDLLSTFPNLSWTFFCFFSHFLDLFGLISPVTCTEITLCTENSATLMPEFGASHITLDASQNSRHNHGTMPDIFGIKHFFPVWHESDVLGGIKQWCDKGACSIIGHMCYGSEYPLFISFFLHNQDMFCYFGSFLVDSGRFQLTSTTFTIFLLVELVVIKHGHHLVSFSYQQPQGGCFSYSCASNIIWGFQHY